MVMMTVMVMAMGLWGDEMVVVVMVMVMGLWGDEDGGGGVTLTVLMTANIYILMTSVLWFLGAQLKCSPFCSDFPGSLNQMTSPCSVFGTPCSVCHSFYHAAYKYFLLSLHCTVRPPATLAGYFCSLVSNHLAHEKG
jgi:hypothetical protein